MIEFNKRFLYTFADVEKAKKLIGKQCIFSSSYIDESMILNLPTKTLREVLSVDEDIDGFIFRSEDRNKHKFLYYDPDLMVKRAYYLEGKQIQCKIREPNSDWYDCKGEPNWTDPYKFRVKPRVLGVKESTYLTVREVSEWLAKGYGEILFVNNNTIATSLDYDQLIENEQCKFKIRKWEDTDWHDATREYLEDKELRG